MKCLDDHHRYELLPFENVDFYLTEVRFIKKEPILSDNPEDRGKLRTVHNGTTNEEVLKMLIHRLNGLNTKFPCRENSIALTHIETALLWLEKRTADRISRGVEGKQIK